MKYKVNKARAFVIGGYTADNPLDALIVGYYEGDKLIFCKQGSEWIRAPLAASCLGEVEAAADSDVPIR